MVQSAHPVPASEAPIDPILRIEDLRTHFFRHGRRLPAVDGVSFAVGRGETLGLVGESGCGKSVSALSILRLIPDPPGRIVGGAIHYNGHDLLELSSAELRRIRGNDISMIFQEPMTSLNPVLTIGRQITETVIKHRGVSRTAARDRAAEMLDLVQVPDARRRLKEYPHQLSGGLRQRAMIAMALACDPHVLIADEPTTALDVTIQAQILDLLRGLQDRLGMATIMITHDLGVIAEMADTVAVMYAGRKVEEAPVNVLFDTPQHPYTRGLLASVPRTGANARQGSRTHLAEIPGLVPALDQLPQGCTFAPRCPHATEECRTQVPPLAGVQPGHQVACWHAGTLPGNADD